VQATHGRPLGAKLRALGRELGRVLSARYLQSGDFSGWTLGPPYRIFSS
jgi:hypothetical protein